MRDCSTIERGKETACELIRAGELWQYVVLLHPTGKERENGEISKVVVELAATVACSEDDARLEAASKIPENVRRFRTRLEVVVRRF